MTHTVDAIQHYSDEDRFTWASLLDEYVERLLNHGCKQAISGFEKLEFCQQIESIPELSKRLHNLCGWRVQPVESMISVQDLLGLMSAKIYPVASQMRKPDELNFAKFPDLFHDVMGHLPMLLHPPYRQFLERYSHIVNRFIDSKQVVQAFGRLYWYTIETGLIIENDCEKIYGAAILTSHYECKNALSKKTPKRPLDLDLIFSTNYNSFKLQPWYFVIESFESLLAMTDYLDTYAEKLYETDAYRF